jgi:hypothetical protein
MRHRLIVFLQEILLYNDFTGSDHAMQVHDAAAARHVK